VSGGKGKKKAQRSTVWGVGGAIFLRANLWGDFEGWENKGDVEPKKILSAGQGGAPSFRGFLPPSLGAGLFLCEIFCPFKSPDSFCMGVWWALKFGGPGLFAKPPISLILVLGFFVQRRPGGGVFPLGGPPGKNNKIFPPNRNHSPFFLPFFKLLFGPPPSTFFFSQNKNKGWWGGGKPWNFWGFPALFFCFFVVVKRPPRSGPAFPKRGGAGGGSNNKNGGGGGGGGGGGTFPWGVF